MSERNPKTPTQYGYHLGCATVADVKQAVCRTFGVLPIDIVSARRSRDIARPRQVAMYLSRQLTPYSLPHIGRMFGNRDHTTVMHAIAQVPRLMLQDESFRTKVESARAEIVSKEKQQSVENPLRNELAEAA